MGGSSKQVVGHKYFASLVKFIGFRVEGIFAVNFDNRKWIWADPKYKKIGNKIEVNEPNLYGENEGGVQGVIDLQIGTPDQQPHPHYVAFDPEISGFPYQSYLVFRGAQDVVTQVKTINKWGLLYNKLIAKTGPHSFYHGNTNTMRDVLLWPKRTRVQNENSHQWHMLREDGAIVCEIDAFIIERKGDAEQPDDFYVGVYSKYTQFGYEHKVEWQSLTNLDAHTLTTGGWANASAVSGNGYDSKTEVKILVPSRIDALATVTVQFTYNRDSRPLLSEIGCQIVNIIEEDGGDGLIRETITAKAILKADSATTIGFLSQLGKSQELKQNTLSKLMIYVEIGKYSASGGDGVDINPIHKIREILTNPSPWGMGKDVDEINDENFIKAADRIWDEKLGISWAIKDKDCIEAIQELCNHIEAGVRVNRQTGKHEVVLFRDDWFDEDEIHTISESQIKSMQLEVQNADEVINHVNVKYYDRENIKDGAFSISENGLIKTVGQVISEDLEFPYFMRKYNAELVAGWKLRQLSTPAWKGAFTTGFREARKWNRYDLIDLPWSRKWQDTIRVRIMAIKLGTATDNEVSIEFVEVVDFSNVQPSTGVDESYSTQPLEPQPNISAVFELPYYFWIMLLGQKDTDDQLNYDETTGIAAAIAVKPQNNSLYAIMMTHSGIEGEEWDRAASVYYSPAAITTHAVGLTDKQIQVEDASIFVDLKSGTLIYVRGPFEESLGEWVSFESVDIENNVITVKRGVLDTMPRSIDHSMYLITCDTNIAIDQSYYIESDNVLVSTLTTTPSGIQEHLGSSLVNMQARAIRPYPPANVQICGEYWPDEIESDLVITWANRNRKEQTARTHLDWFDANNMPLEANTVTTLIVTEFDENNAILATYNSNVTAANTWTLNAANMSATARKINIELKTTRDGFDCLNPFTHTVELSQFFSEPYDLTVEFKND